MKNPRMESRQFRIIVRNTAFVAAVLVLAYTLAGFLLVPWAAKRELPRYADEQLHRSARVGNIEFNPYTLTLRVRDFALVEKDGRPMLGLREAFVDLEWRSLVRRGWMLSELRLVEPSVRFEISREGQFNLAVLAPKPSGDAAQSGPPRFAIGHLAIDNGSIDFEDRREDYKNRLERLSFELSSLSTLASDKGSHELAAQTMNGALLRWKGELALAPLAATGTLVFENGLLPQLNPYLDDYVAANITSGQVSLELHYRFALAAGKPQLNIHDTKFTLQELALTASGATTPFAKVGEIAADGVTFDLQALRASAQALRVANVTLDAKRDAAGELDLMRIFAAAGAGAAKPAETPAAWQASIDAVKLDNISASYTDETGKTPVTANARGLHARLKLEADSSGQGTRIRADASELGVEEIFAGPPSLQRTALGLAQISVKGARFDSSSNSLEVDAARIAKVTLNAKRNAAGELDLMQMFTVPGTGTATPAQQPAAWQAGIHEVALDDVSASYTDETAKVPVSVIARGLRSRFKLEADSSGQGTRIRAVASALGLDEIFAGPASREQAALRLAQISVTGARFDSSNNALDIAAVRAGSFSADAVLEDGRLSLLDLVPAASAAKPGTPLAARVKSIVLAGGNASFADRASGLALALEHMGATLSDVSFDTSKPLAFEASASVQSGGALSARGRIVPATGALESRVEASGLSLVKLQPLLVQYANVKLASGEVSIAGDLRAGDKEAKLSYSGSAAVSDVAIQDDAGMQLLAWKSLSAGTLNLTLAPNGVQIDELRWSAPTSKLAIATDRTTNIGRTLKRKDAAPAPAPAPAAPKVEREAAAVADDKPDEAGNFAVAIRRVRIEEGALDFSDDSLRPGFSVDVRGLDGTLNNISSDRSTRSQLSLEGRVGEFGFARLTGVLNALAPHEFATFRMRLNNLDATKVSPYAIRFAGYRIASGRISLDLNYRLRANRIEGDNQIVLDHFTLGERIESPQALDLPLELAIALLKDADGRIDVAVPVAGNLDDPKFDYGAIIWKAIGNLITGIVAAPFRALARLFGGSDEQLGAIAFEPGSSRLLPPEREKLGRIVDALAKRPELKLVIPGRYDAEADARALKRAALRREIGRRAGFEVEHDDPPGPISIEDRPTREALRALFSERFSATELDRLKTEAETKARAASTDGEKPQQLSVFDRLRNFTRGEPQVTDAREFYRTLIRRLLDAQPLAAEALPELAQKRAAAIAAALTTAGADPARITRSQAEPIATRAGAKEVTLQLSLAATR